MIRPANFFINPKYGFSYGYAWNRHTFLSYLSWVTFFGIAIFVALKREGTIINLSSWHTDEKIMSFTKTASNYRPTYSPKGLPFSKLIFWGGCNSPLWSMMCASCTNAPRERPSKNTEGDKDTHMFPFPEYCCNVVKHWVGQYRSSGLNGRMSDFGK